MSQRRGDRKDTYNVKVFDVIDEKLQSAVEGCVDKEKRNIRWEKQRQSLEEETGGRKGRIGRTEKRHN